MNRFGHSITYCFLDQTTAAGQQTVFTEELLQKMVEEVASDEETAKVIASYREEKGKDAWEKVYANSQKP